MSRRFAAHYDQRTPRGNNTRSRAAARVGRRQRWLRLDGAASEASALSFTAGALTIALLCVYLRALLFRSERSAECNIRIVPQCKKRSRF